MLEAILLLSLERVVVSGKSIARQDTDVITFTKDLFCDTHLARPPESEKRDVLREESIDIAILSVATPGRFIRAFDGCEAIELKQSLRTGLQDLSSDALLLRCSDAEVSQDRAAVLT